jgi:hypothetical protein
MKKNKCQVLGQKPSFGVVQSKERYKRNPKRDRVIIGDGSTNSMTLADDGAVGGPVEGESRGDNEGGDGDVGADEGGVDACGVDEVGVETGAKMGAGAGTDVVISL